MAKERRAATVPPEVVAWMRQTAVPFAHVDPGTGFEDLEHLKELIGDAQVLGLGESTHGTREFFTMKHRILEFAADRCGFGAFAMEANWPESERVDTFVQTGAGDPVSLLHGLHFWTWRTEEVLELIRWMRGEVGAGRRMRFSGFDVQFPHAAMEQVIAYLDARDSSAAARARAAYERLTRHWPAADPFAADRKAEADRLTDAFRSYQALPSSERAAGKKDAAEPYAILSRMADGTREHSVALRAAWMVVQAERGQRFAAGWIEREYKGLARVAMIARVVWASRLGMRDASGRDEAMAPMVDWIKGDDRIVLWAHNGHVLARRPVMGWHLRQRYQRRYVAVGLVTAEGDFRARTAHPEGLLHSGDPTIHTLPAAAPGSLDEALALAGPDRFFIDLRKAPDGPVGKWLKSRQRMITIGAVYGDEIASIAPSYPVTPARDFDILCFIRQTTASRPLA